MGERGWYARKYKDNASKGKLPEPSGAKSKRVHEFVSTKLPKAIITGYSVNTE